MEEKNKNDLKNDSEKNENILLGKNHEPEKSFQISFQLKNPQESGSFSYGPIKNVKVSGGDYDFDIPKEEEEEENNDNNTKIITSNLKNENEKNTDKEKIDENDNKS